MLKHLSYIINKEYKKSIGNFLIYSMHSKSQRHKPYSFLKQLLIPEQPWNSISMDFIKQLPDSLGYTAILMIVCRL